MGFMKVIPCNSTEMEPEYRNTKVLDWLREREESWDKTLCPYHCNRQCELFPIGSIVYYVKHSTSVSNMYFVHWGVVIEHYSGQISLQLYSTSRRSSGKDAWRFMPPSTACHTTARLSRWERLASSSACGRTSANK